MTRDRIELRAREAVASCLIRRLTVPRVYFEANWPGNPVDQLGANVRLAAERFPDAVYDIATQFSGSHKANIQFGG